MPRPIVAISVSGSPDAGRLGFDEAHLHRLSADLAELFLAHGFDLAYGGDLRGGGFTETLIGLCARQAQTLSVSDAAAHEPRLLSYLAWPFVETLTKEAEATLRHTCRFRSVMPDEVGWELEDLDWKRALSNDDCTVRDAWIMTTCLTRMRRLMDTGDPEAGLPSTALRVVLGGKLTGMKGLLPGVVEEAGIAIERGTPLIVIGGYGGGGGALGRAIFGGEIGEELFVRTQKTEAPFDRLMAEPSGLEVEVPDVKATYKAVRATLEAAQGSDSIQCNGLSLEASRALAGVGDEALGVGDEVHMLQLIRGAAEELAKRHWAEGGEG